MLQRYHESTTLGKPGFELLPAIDLRGGRVVRLLRGDFDAETVYADDPVDVAGAFVAEGARWLHVVDLDGAAGTGVDGRWAGRRDRGAVGERRRCRWPAGCATSAAVAAALAAGAARVVVGTAALADPAFAAALVEATVRPGSRPRSTSATGSRRGRLARRRRRAGRSRRRIEALGAAGIETFVVTAIDRDGTLAGPDLALLERLVGLGRGRLVASGGIRSLDDLRRVRALGCAGAILGRALYEGRLTVAEALGAVR